MTLRRKALRFIMPALLLVSTGCASHHIANLDEYQAMALEKSKFAPAPEVLERGRARVVVFALDENGNGVAEQARLGLSMAGNIEAVLTENKTVELVDRKIASKLQDEIKLAEMNQTGSYEGPAVADYAISGTLSDASFTHKFFEATRTTDKKGRVHTTNPSFRYTAFVEGTVKVYEIPSMKVVRTFKISDNKGRSEETRNSQNYIERDDNLVRGAGQDAIGSIKADLKNELAPKGYVLDKRVKNSTAVFKITLGSDNGARPGDKCEVYTVDENVNQLTGKTESEKRKLCDGVISDQITQKSCWIVTPLDESKKVKLGDQVKVVYSKGAFEYMKDAGSVMNSFIAK